MHFRRLKENGMKEVASGFTYALAFGRVVVS